MKILEHHIKVRKTARYFSTKPNPEKVRVVLFVIHGYAQLAKDFINDFVSLGNDDTLIIAPEGLSKFYFRNKIGASWMTKEDRLNEINDYIDYLDRLFEEIRNKYDLSKAKFNLLGFSQGVHTAVRWYIQGDIQFDNLILCSSDFPKDADFIKLKNKLEKSKLYFVYGSNDEVIGEKTFKESIDLLNANEVQFEKIIFEDGHKINIHSLNLILTK